MIYELSLIERPVWVPEGIAAHSGETGIMVVPLLFRQVDTELLDWLVKCEERPFSSSDPRLAARVVDIAIADGVV